MPALILLGDATTLPFPDQSIDLVLTAIPHPFDRTARARAFAEIARVCRGRVTILTNVPGQQVLPGVRYPAFPEGYIRALIGLNSQIGDRVLDCFAGTGVAVKVAEKMGRVGIGVELDPRLVGV